VTGSCAVDAPNQLTAGRQTSRAPAATHLMMVLGQGDGDMRYKGFLIGAFEQKSGRWCARIGRAHGRLLKSTEDRRLQDLVAGIEYSSAVDALTMAMEAVDTGFFAERWPNKTPLPVRLGKPRPPIRPAPRIVKMFNMQVARHE